MADPGFLVGGGVDLVGGGVDSRGSYDSNILYVETKESGPLGGRAPSTPPLDPPMHPSIFLAHIISIIYTHYSYQILPVVHSSTEEFGCKV